MDTTLSAIDFRYPMSVRILGIVAIIGLVVAGGYFGTVDVIPIDRVRTSTHDFINLTVFVAAPIVAIFGIVYITRLRLYRTYRIDEQGIHVLGWRRREIACINWYRIQGLRQRFLKTVLQVEGTEKSLLMVLFCLGNYTTFKNTISERLRTRS